MAPVQQIQHVFPKELMEQLHDDIEKAVGASDGDFDPNAGYNLVSLPSTEAGAKHTGQLMHFGRDGAHDAS